MKLKNQVSRLTCLFYWPERTIYLLQRWEIAKEIVKGLDKVGDIEVVPISSAEFPLPAPRPRSEMLRNLKLELLGLDEMPHWKEALRTYIDENKDKE